MNDENNALKELVRRVQARCKRSEKSEQEVNERRRYIQKQLINSSMVLKYTVHPRYKPLFDIPYHSPIDESELREKECKLCDVIENDINTLFSEGRRRYNNKRLVIEYLNLISAYLHTSQ